MCFLNGRFRYLNSVNICSYRLKWSVGANWFFRGVFPGSACVEIRLWSLSQSIISSSSQCVHTYFQHFMNMYLILWKQCHEILRLFWKQNRICETETKNKNQEWPIDDLKWMNQCLHWPQAVSRSDTFTDCGCIIFQINML